MALDPRDGVIDGQALAPGVPREIAAAEGLRAAAKREVRDAAEDEGEMVWGIHGVSPSRRRAAVSSASTTRPCVAHPMPAIPALPKSADPLIH